MAKRGVRVAPEMGAEMAKAYEELASKRFMMKRQSLAYEVLAEFLACFLADAEELSSGQCQLVNLVSRRKTRRI